MVNAVKLAKLRDDRAKGIERMTELVDLAAESGFSDDQRDELKKLQAEDKSLNERIDAIQSLDVLSTEFESTAPTGRVSDPDTLRIGKVKEGWESDPKRGFKHNREFLLSTMEAFKEQRITDVRLNGCKSLAVGSDEQSIFADPYGGFLMPEGFSPNLLTVASESDPTAGRVLDIPMTSPSLSIPARVDKNHTSSVSGGLTVTRREESGAATSSRMEMEKVKLEANGLFGLAYATEELLSRSPISFAALLEAGFREEFRSEILNEKLNGTGVGEYEGINNSPAVVTVAKEGGQSADTIVAANIYKMRSRTWGYGNAIWLANHDTIPQLAALNDGTNNIFLVSATEDLPDMLLGRPIFFTEYTETLGDKGDILCGNWSQYLEGTLESVQSAESVHVRFVNHERTFKFWTYNDGRCWWRSALTPKKSSNTLSPFVNLAARA